MLYGEAVARSNGGWKPPLRGVFGLAGLVRMKLMSHRDQDRVHLRDLIEVDLIDRGLLQNLPPDLATRLDALLSEAGRWLARHGRER